MTCLLDRVSLHGNETLMDWEWDCDGLGMGLSVFGFRLVFYFSRSKTNVYKNLNSYDKRRK